MKRFNLITVLLLLLLPLSAQQTEADSLKRAKEREVKTSGLYLYGEAVHADKNEAIKAAKLILTSEINKEILAHPNWQFAQKIEAKDVEYSTDHIDLLRGSKVRVIAYIRKDGIEAIFDKSNPDIKLTDKIETKESKKKEKTTDVPLLKDDNAPETVQAELITPETAVSVPEVTEVKPEEETPAVTDEPIIDLEEIEFTDDDTELVDDDLSDETNLPTSTGNAILDDLISAKNINEASTLFTKYKRTGKLVYGKPGTSLALDKSYLMVYNRQGEITAILDIVKDNGRVDLLTGEEVDNQFIRTAVYVWFQLFD